MSEHPTQKSIGKRFCLRNSCFGALLIFVLLVVYAFDSDAFDNTILNPVMKWRMLTVAREWARLEPLPDSAEAFTMKTTGGMFTRTFEGSFRASLTDIKKWIDASPGTSKLAPTKVDDSVDDVDVGTAQAASGGLGQTGTWYYKIRPGGGAGYAGVWVDVEAKRVRIKASWS